MNRSGGIPGRAPFGPPTRHPTLSHSHDRSHKESDYEHITNQLIEKLKDIGDLESILRTGMQKSPSQESTDAVRKYYAAFPALKKGHQSPLHYFLPPPAWCRKPIEESNKRIIMQKVNPGDWSLRNKKLTTCKERRNSYHGQKKSNSSKKRCHSYSKSFESNENLPEWFTHEGVWDLETQDPVREFIRAIALDEGYGTCENTLTDDIRVDVIARVDMRIKETAVPQWGDDMDLDAAWVLDEEPQPRPRSPTEDESYAKFEAKFDSSIEALWYKEQANTPDDECQELPVDFQDLLSSPMDRPAYEPARDKCSLISLSESIWSNDAFGTFIGGGTATPGASIDILHDRFKPLNLADETRSPEKEPISLYSYGDVYDSVPSVASVMRSLTALNHSKSRSSFTEVLPRRPAARPHATLAGLLPEPQARVPDAEEDLLTSERTHFRPIGKESLDAAAAPPPAPRYADGATFDICSDFDTVVYCRSHSGSIFVESEAEKAERYLVYRSAEGDHFEGDPDAKLKFSLKFRMRQTEKCVQTEERGEADPREEVAMVGSIGGERWGACDECARLAGAKKMRASGAGLESIWSAGGGIQEADGWCGACSAREPPPPSSPRPPFPDEWCHDWEDLLTDISCAHARYAAEAEGAGGAAAEWWRRDRKRRHSAMVWCAAELMGVQCPHPHDVPFLHFCASERPLTR